MVVEHSFVTRLEAEETMRLALAFLQERGFAPSEPMGFRMAGDAWTTLKLRRGRKATARAALLDLPQTIQLEWDRGRVSVAASIEVPKKELPAHSQLLVSITLALEELLTQGVPTVNVGREWNAVESVHSDARRTKRRRRRTWTIIAVLFFGLCIVALTCAIISSRP